MKRRRSNDNNYYEKNKELANPILDYTSLTFNLKHDADGARMSWLCHDSNLFNKKNCIDLLDTSGNNFDVQYNDTYTKLFSNMLSLNETITTLKINLSFDNLKILYEGLKKNISITYLSLHRKTSPSFIGSDGAKIISELIKKNSTITKLDLSNNNIGIEGIVSLAEGIEVNSGIKELYLSDNIFIKSGKYSGIKKLSKAIAKNSSIMTLAINHVNDTIDIVSEQSSDHGDIIFNFLSKMIQSTSLQYLYIRSNCLCEPLSNLEKEKTTQEIFLLNNIKNKIINEKSSQLIEIYDNNIITTNGPAFDQMFDSTLSAETDLMQSTNSDLMQSAKSDLTQSAKTGSTQNAGSDSTQIANSEQIPDLVCCSSYLIGLNRFAEVLSTNERIIELDLSRNHISSIELKILVIKGLSLNKSIQNLYLEYNIIGSYGMKFLLNNCPNLFEIFIQSNCIYNAMPFKTELINSKLNLLHITSNSTDNKEFYGCLYECIKQNITIKNLTAEIVHNVTCRQSNRSSILKEYIKIQVDLNRGIIYIYIYMYIHIFINIFFFLTCLEMDKHYYGWPSNHFKLPLDLSVDINEICYCLIEFPLELLSIIINMVNMSKCMQKKNNANKKI
jgi:hypothetical protein